MNIIKRAALTWAILTLSCLAPVAKADEDNFKALCECELILVAEYKGCENSRSVSPHNPPIADFWVMEVLKGPPISVPPFRVRFESDTVPTKIPPHWKFDERVMPEKNSRWLLFIEHPESHDKIAHLTFHGSVGRVEYSDDNEARVLRNISSKDR
jgi:hypothetical protein